MKILQIHVRIIKTMKIIEINLRIMKIKKIQKINMIIKKIRWRIIYQLHQKFGNKLKAKLPISLPQAALVVQLAVSGNI